MSNHSYPYARIGIIGGGQLGRMMVTAAKRLGCTCVVLDPTPNSPAGQIAAQQIVGELHDPDKLRELVESSDITTYEIEHIDVATLQGLADEGNTIRPAPQVLSVIQDKLTQKQAFADNDIPTADFVKVGNIDEKAFADFGYPLVQKARKGGYDGRGVAIMRSADDFSKNLPVDSLLERFIPAEKEIAVLVARDIQGNTCAYPPVEMCFTEENILETLIAPANIDDDIAEQATDIALRVIKALNGTGIFGVEMFVTKDKQVLVNEVAPRTHNSGHQTIEANITDQFEQHLRAVIGLPLGATEQLSAAAMINLLGEPDSQGLPIIEGLDEALAIPGVCVHFYGKASSKPHRKMGHVTILDKDTVAAKQKADQVRNLLKIKGDEQS